MVEISARDLAVDLGISRDAVKVAARALAPWVTSRNNHGVAMLWTLPAEWFVIQRSLFAMPSPVDNSARWTSNQATVAWKPGQPVDEKPGHTGLETRPHGRVTRPLWTTYQATSGLETRPQDTQVIESTQVSGLETRPSSIDRDRGLSSVEPVVNLRDSIETVNRLPEELRQDAENLKRWLRSFFAQIRAGDTIPDGPDEIILAKCLAIAQLGRLAHSLKKLHSKQTRCGDNWAWWVTVFCQRIHGTKDTTAVPAPMGFHQPKKPASHEGGGQFPADLLQKVTAAARTM